MEKILLPDLHAKPPEAAPPDPLRKEHSHAAARLLPSAAFFLGLALGAAIANLWGDTYLKESQLFGAETLQKIGSARPEAREYFRWLLPRRLKYLLLLWMAGHTALGVPAAVCALLLGGCTAGMFLSLAYIHARFSGFLLFLAAALPQALAYAPMLWLAATAICERRLFSQKDVRWVGKNGQRRYNRKFAVALLFLLLGLFLESTANPWLLRQLIGF